MADNLDKEFIREQRKTDEMYMRRCIQLARNGRVGAPPNPMVGAVVVHEGRIIGEGYHRQCGTAHAEVNALASVTETELLPESTIYVSLEPCAHYGKTPPCADLIVSKMLKRCVVGCRDPFSKVDGLGIKKLRDAGIEVEVGVLEEECLALNEPFMTFHNLHRPFVTLKWAQSEDGFIDGKRQESGEATRFSTALTMTLVHRRRALADAILVGGGTAVVDNPSLNVRAWSGRNPLRVVIDTHGDLSEGLRVFDDEAETLVWPSWDLNMLMAKLHSLGVQTLLVEGGAETHRHFLKADLWDELRVETAPIRLEGGVKAAVLPDEASIRMESELCLPEGNTIRIYRRKA